MVQNGSGGHNVTVQIACIVQERALFCISSAGTLAVPSNCIGVDGEDADTVRTCDVELCSSQGNVLKLSLWGACSAKCDGGEPFSVRYPSVPPMPVLRLLVYTAAAFLMAKCS